MHICGTGTNPSWVEAAARLLGGSIRDCPPADAPLDDDIVYLLAGPTDKTLADAIGPPRRICYALDTNFDIKALRKPHPILDGSDRLLGLCLSARAAYELPVGSLIASVLSAKLPLAGTKQLNVDIALNEAIANALLHGCLDLHTPDDRFDPAFIDAIEARIDDPTYGSRPIWVAAHTDGDALSLCVADEGKGFTPAAVPDLDTPEKASRGMGLIHAAADHVAYEDQGRCLEMKFNL